MHAPLDGQYYYATVTTLQMAYVHSLHDRNNIVNCSVQLCSALFFYNYVLMRVTF